MLIKVYRNLEEILGSVLLVAMCLVAIVQVASRYCFSSPFSWTEEVCTILFVWITFIGASLALKTSEHFAVEVIVEKLPAKLRLPLKLLSCTLIILFSVLLLGFGIRFTGRGLESITPALEIPRAVPYAAVPVGGLLMLIRGIELTVKLIQRSGRPSGNE